MIAHRTDSNASLSIFETTQLMLLKFLVSLLLAVVYFDSARIDSCFIVDMVCIPLNGSQKGERT